MVVRLHQAKNANVVCHGWFKMTNAMWHATKLTLNCSRARMRQEGQTAWTWNTEKLRGQIFALQRSNSTLEFGQIAGLVWILFNTLAIVTKIVPQDILLSIIKNNDSDLNLLANWNDQLGKKCLEFIGALQNRHNILLLPIIKLIYHWHLMNSEF